MLVEAVHFVFQLLVLPLHLLLLVGQQRDLALVLADQLVDVTEEGRPVLQHETGGAAALAFPLQAFPQLFQFLLEHLHALGAGGGPSSPVLLGLGL